MGSAPQTSEVMSERQPRRFSFQWTRTSPRPVPHQQHALQVQVSWVSLSPAYDFHKQCLLQTDYTATHHEAELAGTLKDTRHPIPSAAGTN